MTSYIMYDILSPSVIWKNWLRGPPNFISRKASDGLDLALSAEAGVVVNLF